MTNPHAQGQTLVDLEMWRGGRSAIAQSTILVVRETKVSWVGGAESGLTAVSLPSHPHKLTLSQRTNLDTNKHIRCTSKTIVVLNQQKP